MPSDETARIAVIELGCSFERGSDVLASVASAIHRNQHWTASPEACRVRQGELQMEFVEKFSIPHASRVNRGPVAFAAVACTVPAANLNEAPDFACDSGLGIVFPSACGIVGAVAIWCVVVGSGSSVVNAMARLGTTIRRQGIV